jgi:uncharacterized membrane protein YdfJ with MMPL/SSD domain
MQTKTQQQQQQAAATGCTRIEGSRSHGTSMLTKTMKMNPQTSAMLALINDARQEVPNINKV